MDEQLDSNADDAALLRWLENDEAGSRFDRVGRLRFLLVQTEEFPFPSYVGFHGFSAFQYFLEARLCYLNGLYASTVIMSQAALESSLRAAFYASGDDESSEKSFAALIGILRERGRITSRERARLDRLRSLRNPHVHTPNLNDPKSLPGRMKAANPEKDQTDILRGDAQFALSVLFQFIRRSPFSL